MDAPDLEQDQDETQDPQISGGDEATEALLAGMRGGPPSSSTAQAFLRAAQGPGIRPVPATIAKPSKAAQDLSTFSNASGSPSTASQLSQAPPPPQAPTMPPGYAAAQEDLRKNAAVTPKLDPDTNQPLDKYKMGFGQRLGRIFQDLATGGISGVVRGVADKSSPGYYGPGAVNDQYQRDEATRQAQLAGDQAKIGSYEGEAAQKQKEFADLNKQYEDEIKKRYESDLGTVREQTAEERERHNEETEDLKRQLQEATSPQAKAQAEFNARQSVANAIGLKGQDRKMYLANGKLPDDQLKAKELQIREAELGLRTREVNAKEGETNEFGLTANEQRGVNNLAPGVMKSLSDLSKERSQNIAAGMDTKALDAEIAKQTSVLNDAVVKVRSGRKPAPGGSRPAASPSGNQPPAKNPKGYKNQVTGKYYSYGATMKNGQSIGSDDGKTWFDVKTGQNLQ